MPVDVEFLSKGEGAVALVAQQLPGSIPGASAPFLYVRTTRQRCECSRLNCVYDKLLVLLKSVQSK